MTSDGPTVTTVLYIFRPLLITPLRRINASSNSNLGEDGPSTEGRDYQIRLPIGLPDHWSSQKEGLNQPYFHHGYQRRDTLSTTRSNSLLLKRDVRVIGTHDHQTRRESPAAVLLVLDSIWACMTDLMKNSVRDEFTVHTKSLILFLCMNEPNEVCFKFLSIHLISVQSLLKFVNVNNPDVQRLIAPVRCLLGVVVSDCFL